MSNDRASRRSNDKKIIKKRKKLLKHVDENLGKTYEGKENKLATKHPLDCGNAKCGVCHSHKVNKASKSKNKDEHDIKENLELKEIVDEMSDFGD